MLKPDKGRLLTDEEINLALGRKNFHTKELLPSYEYDSVITKAQDAKTASIKDRECQQKVKQARQEIVEEIAKDEQLLEIGRKAVEDILIDWRDSRLSEPFRGNGLVIREKDGKDSSIIRFGPEVALRIGLKAIGQELKRGVK